MRPLIDAIYRAPCGCHYNLKARRFVAFCEDLATCDLLAERGGAARRTVSPRGLAGTGASR